MSDDAAGTIQGYDDPVDLDAAIDENEIVRDAPLRLLAKLADIFAAIDGIEKRGTGTDSSGVEYSYVQSKDVLAVVRAKMAEHCLLLEPHLEESARSPRDDSGKSLSSATIVYTWICCETGQSKSFRWKGAGEDDGDKGLYMAYTGSKKYFLLDFFLIPTYNDPEGGRNAGSESGRPPLQAVGEAQPRPAEATA